MDFLRACVWPAFKEGIPVRIEEISLPARNVQPAMPGALEDQPEENEKSGPRTIPLIHRVGVVRLILAKPVEKSVDRIVVDEGLVRGKEIAVLGIQDKDEPEQNGEQTGVDLIRVVAQDTGENAGLVMRRLDAPE